jgi:hypothetical protein
MSWIRVIRCSKVAAHMLNLINITTFKVRFLSDYCWCSRRFRKYLPLDDFISGQGWHPIVIVFLKDEIIF